MAKAALSEDIAVKYGVFDQLVEGVQVLDTDWQYLYVNQSAANQGKATVDELLNTNLLEKYPGVENSNLFKELQACLIDGQPHRFLNEFYFPDNSVGWFELSIQKVPEGVLIISHDTTQRKTAELATQARENRLKSILDTITEGVVLNEMVFDKKGNMIDYRILEVNKAFYKIAEVLHEGGVVGELASKVYGLSRDNIKAFWEKHKDSTSVRLIEYESPYSGRHFSVATSPFENGLFVTSFHDVTEAKYAEGALRDSQKHLQDILEHSYDAIITIDLEYKILSFNSRAQDTFKSIFRKKIKTYDNLLAFFPVPAQIEWQELLDSAFNGKQSLTEKTVQSGRREFHFSLSINPIKAGNEIIAVSIFSRDVTTRRAMDDALKKIEKLKSVGTLAGGIAHDFNNVLLGIFANISVVKEQLDSKNKLHSQLDDALDAMHRASGLTKQLLTYAEGGKPVKKLIDIAAMVEEVVRFDLAGSRIRPVFTIDPKLAKLSADRGQLIQVISNLTSNAVQSMPHGGRLFVSLGHVKLSKPMGLLSPGKYMLISLMDEGIGIPRQNLGKIFDPYFSTRELGNGLGLATTYSIVRKHGGDIKVESTINKGSKFDVYLPIGKRSRKPLKSRLVPVRKKLPKKGRVLVMDDMEMLRKVIKTILIDDGHDVDAVENGQLVLEKYEKAMKANDPYSLVIMDLTIPGGMGGKETIKHLVKLDPNAKVIATSGYTNDPVMSSHSEYGFKAVLTKPYTNDELIKTVDQLI